MSTSQKLQARKAPSPGGKPSTVLWVSIAQHKSVTNERAFDGGDRASDAGIVRRQKADNGNEQQTRVERRIAERLDKRILLRDHTRARTPPHESQTRTSRQRSRGPARPNSSIERTARSNATHAITFECVKWRRPPRTSQMPSSGSRQIFSEVQNEPAFQRPGRVAGGETRAARDIKGVKHFAIDVELELSDRAIADSDRGRAFVARQPGNFIFFKPAFSRDAVDDLQIIRRTGDRAQEPLVPRLRLVENAGANQRIEGEGRVPKPAIPIVPIARAAQLLWQGRRGGRDDAAGLPVRERLQSQKRAKNRFAPVLRRLESPHPSGPERMDLFARLRERPPLRAGEEPRETTATS